MKAILLAGGTGSRLFPATMAVSKQLLHIYDKPMVYYPMSVLMLAGIRDVLLISTPHDIVQYERLFADGSRFGIAISYMVQECPRGLAEAFILAEDFIQESDVCLILGDNVFYGMGMSEMLHRAQQALPGACIFAYPVQDASNYGVIEFDKYGNAISLEEKPAYPRSNYAVPGLYFYDHSVVALAKSIKPSSRGELEITGVNNIYLRQGKLHVVNLGRGTAWLDTGTPQGLLNAAQFVSAVQSRQGLYIACLEEIAYNKGWLDREGLRKAGMDMKVTEYGKYILQILDI